MDIENKHIYITGSNRGIGLALAKKAASLKSHLHLVNRSPLAEDLVEELVKLGANSVSQLKLDLLSPDDISVFLQDLKSKPVDVFINNAGLLTGGLLEDQPIDQVYKMFQVNLCAVAHICHGLVPIMMKQKSGYIVNNSSVSGKMFFPCANTYAASKAGVVALTESLDQELQGTGVQTLLLITPGVKTEMYDQITDLYNKNLNLDFLTSIDASEWADDVFKSIAHNKNVCLPKGISRFGVSLSQHLPSLFRKIINSKFKR